MSLSTLRIANFVFPVKGLVAAELCPKRKKGTRILIELEYTRDHGDRHLWVLPSEVEDAMALLFETLNGRPPPPASFTCKICGVWSLGEPPCKACARP
jgi:hypothetical protein